MPIIDILIAVAIFISVIVGIVRGFVKEAISVTALLVAIWSALYFGPGVGDIILVFAVVLSIGGLLGWSISKLVRLSVLSGMDRLAGSAFGAARGILFVALAIIGGQYAGFDNDDWWLESQLKPHFEVVADWIKVMAPKGYELLTPAPPADMLEIELPTDQLKLERI